jgi:hypothetical protein
MQIRDLREALDAFPAELRLRLAVRVKSDVRGGSVIDLDDEHELSRQTDGSIALIMDGTSADLTRYPIHGFLPDTRLLI